MTVEQCIFCKIIAKEIPATIVAEKDDLIVLQDRAPKAPIHYLIIPKKHIENIQALTPEDGYLVAKLFFMAQELSESLPGSGAFRLISNNGADAGQSVHHMHIHFIAGTKMTDF